ncbi:XRE family transcriptional regulator [Kitasatospora sp. NPDC005748]|uniref:XRE family transcriptional regulator n=1 Tax=Kitasatospora sp. NPDC005748 TaxID=3157063 RepID=UPI0033CDD844
MTVPRFQLHDPDLLRTLMRRTGDGARTSIRGLAEAAEVHPSHVGELLTGDQKTASFEVASAISGRIGVDLLVLWVPAERAVGTTADAQEVSQ